MKPTEEVKQFTVKESIHSAVKDKKKKNIGSGRPGNIERGMSQASFV